MIVTPVEATEFQERGEIGILELISWLRRSRRVLAIGAAIGFSIMAAYSFTATVWYRAEVVFVPAANESSSATSTLSGLASMAGFNVSTSAQMRTAEFLAVLKSKDFARRFISKNKIDATILARASAWLRTLGVSQHYDLRDAVQYFDDHIRFVDEDKKNGVISLAILWTDPTVAAEWANDMVGLINDDLRQRALDESEQHIAYLQKQLDTVQIAAIQSSISRLLENEMQKAMMARGNPEYAFKVVDSASIPKRRYSPRRLLLTLGGALAGLLVGAAYASMRRTAPRNPATAVDHT